MARLREMPESGRVVAELSGGSYREIIIAPYRVVYRYDEERDLVLVVAVVHGSRLLPAIEEA